MALSWSDSLSVNIIEIDEQHKKLIVMINDLGTAMRTGQSTAALGPVLNNLIAYAGSHFATEEKLMVQHNYPATATHKAEHNSFVKKVTEFKSQFDKGTAMLSVEVINFLTDWLKSHIMKVDKNYGPFLNAKGIK